MHQTERFEHIPMGSGPELILRFEADDFLGTLASLNHVLVRSRGLQPQTVHSVYHQLIILVRPVRVETGRQTQTQTQTQIQTQTQTRSTRAYLALIVSRIPTVSRMCRMVTPSTTAHVITSRS